MIFGFEYDGDVLVDRFLNNWKNPQGTLNMLADSFYIEFNIVKVNDLVVVSQKNFFDVACRTFLLGGVSGLLVSWVLHSLTGFIVCGIVSFVCMLWFSKYVRFYLMFLRLRQLGYKGRLELKPDSFIIQKLLYERESIVSK